MKRLTAKVLSCAPLNAEMGLLALALPAGAEAAVPGQFAHLAVPGDRAHLLRRPISLYSVHDGILELGKGRGHPAHPRGKARRGDRPALPPGARV